MEEIIIFIKVLILVIIIDLFFWIGIFFKKPFANMINDVQNEPMVINPLFAVIGYIVLTSFLYFALTKSDTVIEAFIFGFLLYGVYETTNLATLKNWDVQLATIDMIWGGVLMSILFMILK